MAAILLAFFASQNRSLLAANCLIETIIEMYRRGAQLDTVQFQLSLVTLQSGSTLLSQQELDILTARCGIIMLTLHEVGCSLYSEVTCCAQKLLAGSPGLQAGYKTPMHATLQAWAMPFVIS